MIKRNKIEVNEFGVGKHKVVITSVENGKYKDDTSCLKVGIQSIENKSLTKVVYMCDDENASAKYKFSQNIFNMFLDSIENVDDNDIIGTEITVEFSKSKKNEILVSKIY